ncbi:MAG: thioesterase family protein [Acidobacteriota bacterium]
MNRQPDESPEILEPGGARVEGDPRFAVPSLPESGPIQSFRLKRRIEFSDTDLAGIVHFSRYPVFMEGAEHEMLRALGWGVHFDHEEHDGHPAGWPRLACATVYKSPARFGDELDLRLDILRKGTSSMIYGVTFRCGERLVALGSLSVACCLMAPGMIRPVPIPAALAARLEACDAERAKAYEEVRLPRRSAS